MNYLIILAMTTLVGCASQLEINDTKVMQCRELCSGQVVDVLRIDGLRCFCQRYQPATTPVINNIIVPSANNNTRLPAPTNMVTEYRIISGDKPYTPTIKDNATKINSANGKAIYSQTKE